MDKFMEAEVEEARQGLAEGGIPSVFETALITAKGSPTN